jgi:Amino acid kinase family
MALIVQKYGGTSVGTVERIQAVAQRVKRTVQAGNSVVVVVSAMGKTTDGLVQLATEIAANPSRRELDMLLATGEQVTIALLSMALLEDLANWGPSRHSHRSGPYPRPHSYHCDRSPATPSKSGRSGSGSRVSRR